MTRRTSGSRSCATPSAPVVAPLAEVLSLNRTRGRDGGCATSSWSSARPARIRSAADERSQLGSAADRRLLLREFGGSEGLKELVPLLADTEPLVQREAMPGLVLNGTDEASRSCSMP